MSDKELEEEAALELLRREEVPLKSWEVSRWLGNGIDSGYGVLKRLERKGLVIQNKVGYWELAEGRLGAEDE